MLSDKNSYTLLLSRRKLLKGFLAFGVLSQIPVVWSCSNVKKNISVVFSEMQLKSLQIIQQILFPDDGNGPGAVELKADSYLEWVLLDKRMDADDKKYIYDGFKWVDETAIEDFNKKFLYLNSNQQKQLIKNISQTDWGESWLSEILTYIIEALLADPQYGGNINGIGWQWLHHYPGYPRPVTKLLYGNILNTLKKEYEQKI